MSHHHVNQLIHTLWSTEAQKHLISNTLKNKLCAYITAIVNAKNGRVIAIQAAADHIHLLALLPADISLSLFLGHIKACSSKWLKTHECTHKDFSWQNGYLAISTQQDRLDGVCSYIRSDEVRHQKKSYPEELLGMIKQQNMDYNPDYYLQSSLSKIYVHSIWSTNNRIAYLDKNIRDNLYQQMRGVISSSRGIVHSIGGVEDHIHILMEAPKDKALSDLIREVKTSSTHWLKGQNEMRYRGFEWQTGYGAFTVSCSSVESVRYYIDQQEEHHRKLTFNDEWAGFLRKCK
jgi:putative transposase